MLRFTRTVLLALACAVVALVAGCNRDPGAANANVQSNPGGAQKPMGTSSKRQPIVGPVRYLALGDSTGAGVGARSGGYVARIFRKILEQKPESRLTNRCISGATTSDVLSEQMHGLSEIDPNMVTIGIGINDIGHGVSLETFEKNYEQILQRLRQSTTAVIVVTNIPEISSAPRIPQVMRSQYQQIIVRYNQKLEEIAARQGITVFDVYSITLNELQNHPEYFSSDGFHPSDEGYELWAEAMWPTIAPLAVAADKQD